MTATVVIAACAGGNAQESIPTEPERTSIDVEALTIDVDALIVADQVTTRCSMFAADIAYLTPIEQVGVNAHLGELTAILANATQDSADRLAQMRSAAASMSCDDDALVDYMDFGRQVGRDVIDTAMIAWREIDIAPCSYFADDDFMAAVARAREAAQSATIEGAANRQRFLEQRADGWVELFSSNCGNLYFDPVTTLPGQIALALPTP